MASFRYTETHERYYPRLGLTAKPGDIVEFDTAPDDGRWEPAEPKSRKGDTKKNEE